MATPDWLEGPGQITRVVGAQHPTLANTKDRCGQTIDSMIQVEHTQDGMHNARTTGLSGEIGTFSGNGAARTISLSNAGLTPKKVYVWEDSGGDVLRIDNMASEEAKPYRHDGSAWEADLVDNFQAGSFDVGNTYINSNTVTNYYLVLGVDTDTVPVGDAGAGSDPDWITSSELNRIIADDSATVSTDNIANNVESQIWTEFIEEHTVAGAHSITLQHARIETISWEGNNTDDRVISCSLTDLDILDIESNRDGGAVLLRSDDMAGDNTKAETIAAFSADFLQDISTAGEFEVGLSWNGSGVTYVAVLIGT